MCVHACLCDVHISYEAVRITINAILWLDVRFLVQMLWNVILILNAGFVMNNNEILFETKHGIMCYVIVKCIFFKICYEEQWDPVWKWPHSDWHQVWVSSESWSSLSLLRKQNNVYVWWISTWNRTRWITYIKYPLPPFCFNFFLFGIAWC